MSFDLEATAVQVYLQNRNVSLFSLYISPSYLNIKLNDLVANIPKPFIITTLMLITLAGVQIFVMLEGGQLTVG